MNAPSDVEVAIDELYAHPRDEFVSARNALARTLREKGDSDASRRVKALRKPSLPAWAVNQVARERSDEVAALLDATERARSAALEGDGAALRSATQARNSLIAALTRAAGEALAAGAVANARSHLDQVRDTLLASASEDRADLLRRGRLTETLAGAGFESAFGDAVPAGGGTPEEGAAPTAVADLRLERLREQAAEADRRARRLEDRAAAAEEEAARARAAATAARDAATAAARRVEEAAS
jgi:hypothetical protein